LNRNDIVDYAYSKDSRLENISRKTVRDALDYVLNEISHELLENNSVKLAGFGTFETRKRKDRQGRNPKTGAPLLIKTHRVIVFRPTRNFWEKRA
jgi:nucleoid DNA-binding protein